MTAIVSVVTPFFNSGPYLKACIRSVLEQSHADFEYILLDNCSTDDSLAIAQKYAALDSRIRLHGNQAFLGQVQNFNAALALISPASRYCKLVMADDWLFRDCLLQMVTLAESDASVGLVSSYRMRGPQVTGSGLPVDVTVSSGRDICRAHLLHDERFYFGSASTVMYRSQIVRSRKPFYAENALHEDSEACFEILAEWNFGFVHQVLSYTRTDNESVSSGRRPFNPDLLDRLIILHKYGPQFLEPAQMLHRWRQYEAQYLRFLAAAVLERHGRAFWEYHRRGWMQVGYRPSRVRIAGYLVMHLLGLLLNPLSTLSMLVRAVMNRLQRRP